MSLSNQTTGDDGPQPVQHKLGEGDSRSQEKLAPVIELGVERERRHPDDYWCDPAFSGNWVRRQIDGIYNTQEQDEQAVQYNFQCMMALAQGIKYLCDEPRNILDAGCGPALKSVEMQNKYLPGARIIGCDYSDAMLRHARMVLQNIPEEMRVTVEKQSVYKLTYEDDQFDVVYTYGLFMGLEEPELALAELMRVSRFGLVTIEETEDVMDSVQYEYWRDYKNNRFPGRIYWHPYQKMFLRYKSLISTRIPNDVWTGDKVPPAYVRYIAVK